ncbi:hypothetical protein [Variovorax paradoxus]|uniref:Uncharacterized protein n=1 Tax=Variovorax paradoxus TaxID=34073 RepID=A0A6I6HID4_VARPD|nr:hypothetical protein [Variovorax paradoxus]QGW80387.1 hypothetical protein GOQ09_01720 [Variovorax paradoxus]
MNQKNNPPWYRLALIGLFVPILGMAQESPCASALQEACRTAQKLAAAIQQQLPMKPSPQVSIETAVAEKHVVVVSGRFAFDAETANRHFKQSGVTLEQFQDRYSQSVKPSLCQPSSETYRFFRIGGVVEYRYAYSNNDPFMKFGVVRCD